MDRTDLQDFNLYQVILHQNLTEYTYEPALS